MGGSAPGRSGGANYRYFCISLVSNGTPWANLEIIQNKGSELEHAMDVKKFFELMERFLDEGMK